MLVRETGYGIYGSSLYYLLNFPEKFEAVLKIVFFFKAHILHSKEKFAKV